MIGTPHGIGGLSKAVFACTSDCTEVEGDLHEEEAMDYRKATSDD